MVGKANHGMKVLRRGESAKLKDGNARSVEYLRQERPKTSA